MSTSARHKFSTLSDQQLVALTDEEIRQYCMISAAEAGTPIPGPEPIPFTEKRPSHDAVLYAVGTFNCIDKETALMFQEFVRTHADKLRKTETDWRLGGSIDYITEFDDAPDIREKHLYSAERRVTLRTEIERWGKRKADSEKECSEWRKERDAYNSQVNYIFDAIAEAQQRINSQTRNQARFDEYLRLAGGNAEQAWKFFCAAKLELDGFRPVGAPPLVEVAS